MYIYKKEAYKKVPQLGTELIYGLQSTKQNETFDTLLAVHFPIDAFLWFSKFMKLHKPVQLYYTHYRIMETIQQTSKRHNMA